MSNSLIIKSDNFDVFEHNCQDLKIYNISEVKLCIDFHKDYKIHLYTVNSLDYITVSNEMFFDELLKYCTTNLNYSLMHSVDNKSKVINIWITPIVTSA